MIESPVTERTISRQTDPPMEALIDKIIDWTNITPVRCNSICRVLREDCVTNLTCNRYNGYLRDPLSAICAICAIAKKSSWRTSQFSLEFTFKPFIVNLPPQRKPLSTWRRCSRLYTVTTRQSSHLGWRSNKNIIQLNPLTPKWSTFDE